LRKERRVSVVTIDFDGDADMFDLDYQETPGDDSAMACVGTFPTPFQTTTPLATPTPIIR
jgi:hypothetical protein